jgi:hypothetical protein
MKAAAPFMKPQWRAYAAWLEDGLGRSDFLGGATPSLADVAAWMNIWWTGAAAPTVADELLAGFDRTHAWRDRLRAIGHGRRQDLASADALAVAASATPIAGLESDPDDPSGLKAGDAAIVHADDYGRDPIAGALVAVTRDRVTLAREAGDLGVIHLHVPRVGYVLTRG